MNTYEAHTKAIFLPFERDFYINGRAAKVLHEEDDMAIIGMSSKMNKEIKELFLGAPPLKMEADVAKVNYKIDKLDLSGCSHLYKVYTAAYAPDYFGDSSKTINWIKQKVEQNAIDILMREKFYQKIIISMFEKEFKGVNPQFKLSSAIWKNIQEFSEFKLDVDLPF